MSEGQDERAADPRDALMRQFLELQIMYNRLIAEALAIAEGLHEPPGDESESP